LNFIILGRSIKSFGSSEVHFSLKLVQDWHFFSLGPPNPYPLVYMYAMKLSFSVTKTKKVFSVLYIHNRFIVQLSHLVNHVLIAPYGSLWCLSEKRTSLLPKHLIERPNILKFKNLMTSERKPILQKLCKFIRYINMIVCPPG
jgi:hypothetical protein